MITKVFCYLRFGDPDFYLTKKREEELEDLFKRQGYTITENTIRQVIEFCIYNFRNPMLLEFGSQSYDWKRVLDALIYDGDLEIFLEQQELLQKKLQKITQKYNALSKYGAELNLERSLLWSFKNQTKFNCNERQPLLQSQINRGVAASSSSNSLTTLSKEVKEKMLAVKVLAKLKQHHKHHAHHELLHHASIHLKRQEKCLTEVLFPLQLSPESTESNSPNSNHSEEIYDQGVMVFGQPSQPSPLRYKLK